MPEIEFTRSEILKAEKLNRLSDAVDASKIAGMVSRTSKGSTMPQGDGRNYIEQFRPFDVERITQTKLIVRAGYLEHFSGGSRTYTPLSIDVGTSYNPADVKTITPTLSASTGYAVYLALNTISTPVLTAHVATSIPADTSTVKYHMLTSFTSTVDSTVPDIDPETVYRIDRDVDHNNDLTSLQGGSATERYHLTADEYSSVTNPVWDHEGDLSGWLGGDEINGHWHLTLAEHTALTSGISGTGIDHTLLENIGWLESGHFAALADYGKIAAFSAVDGTAVLLDGTGIGALIDLDHSQLTDIIANTCGDDHAGSRTPVAGTETPYLHAAGDSTRNSMSGIIGDSSNVGSVAPSLRLLYYSSGRASVFYGAGYLADNTSPFPVKSVDYLNRKLYKSDGTTVILDWENVIEIDASDLQPTDKILVMR